MKIYSIVAPFEDWNLPLYSKWSIHVFSVQLINEIDSEEQAQEILLLLQNMDSNQIVSEVLQCVGLSVNQTPLSAFQLRNAYRIYCQSVTLKRKERCAETQRKIL